MAKGHLLGYSGIMVRGICDHVEGWFLDDSWEWSWYRDGSSLVLGFYCGEAWWGCYGDMPESCDGGSVSGYDAFSVMVDLDGVGSEDGCTTVVTELT